MNWISIEKGLPEEGHYLVHTPRSFPKNCPCVVAELYHDGDFKGFYDESGETHLTDVTHYLPITPPIKNQLTCPN